MRVVPSALVDVISEIPAIVPSERSSGIATVAAIVSGGNWLERLLGATPTRVAFAATKADHVPSRARDALAALVEHIALGARGRHAVDRGRRPAAASPRAGARGRRHVVERVHHVDAAGPSFDARLGCVALPERADAGVGPNAHSVTRISLPVRPKVR